MANRIYIAVGLIAILLLGGAFVVPWFIDWNAYKGRMEAMAAEALGIEVAIEGDMSFMLLPQPRLRMADVRVGPATSPLGEARAVEADFSLMDFLRDRFTVTEMRLDQPQLHLTIDADGQLETPITLAETAVASNVSIQNARFSGGVVGITDMRSGNSWHVIEFSGDLRMAALRGPFAVQGQASYGGVMHAVRLSTSAMNPTGGMQVAGFVRPDNGAFAVNVDGLLQTGAVPSLDGKMTYRQAPVDQGDGVLGDMLLESPLVADPDRILLDGFTLLPDENYAATRLTGVASATLGAAPRFDASISGGVVTLLPRAINEDTKTKPFELVRLLGEMPQPILPTLPGRVGMEINELVLRGIGLRDVRLDAVTDGRAWTVEELSGRMAGDTTVKLTGTLARAAGWPTFEGTLAMASRRLDSFSLLWKRPEPGNPLFNMPGSLNGRIQLSGESLRLADGLFVLDGTTHEVSGLIRFGDRPLLELDAALSTLSANRSAALLALLPPIDPAGSFGLSFPEGRLDLVAQAGTLVGQRFVDLSLAAHWDRSGMALEGLRVEDFGGVAFEGSGHLSGTFVAPVVSGSGHLGIRRNARALDLLVGDAGANHPLRRAVLGSLPAELRIQLDPPGREGMQSLLLEGQAGVADIWLSADMAGGFGARSDGQLGITLEAFADSGTDLMVQLGVAPLIAGEDGALLRVSAFGNPTTSLETELTLEGGGERVDFSGTLMVSDWSAIRGQGRTSFLFADSGALLDLAGASGVWFPGLEGQAQLGFVGGDSVTLSEIAAYAGDRALSGSLTYAAQNRSALLSGLLSFDTLDLETLTAMLGGPAATLRTFPGPWVDGPLDIGSVPRETRGRITINTPLLLSGEVPVLEAMGLDYSWDPEEVRLRGLKGALGGGTIEIEAALCCTSSLADKSLTGRFTLEGVSLDSILPETPGRLVDGRLTAGGQFQGNGDSFRTIIAALTGDGSVLVENLSISRLSPGVFSAAAALDDIIGMDPEALETLVVTALDAGAFEATEAGGLFSLAGGTLRMSNIAIEGNGARLLGGVGLRLGDLRLDSSWTLALTQMLGGNGLITETTGRVGVALTGPFTGPQRRLDLAQMVDAIQMRAYEIELHELERLRAEQEARQRAMAEEQARLMEEESRRQAEELLRQQREEAERLEAEEQQRLLEELERQLFDGEAPGAGIPATVPGPGSSVFNLPPSVLQLDRL